MAKQQKNVRILDGIVALPAIVLVGIVRLLPIKVCFALGQMLGQIAWLILPSYRRLTRENITLALGKEMRPRQITALVRKNFRHTGANILCALKMPAMTPEAVMRHAIMDGLDNIRSTIASGRGVVLALNHIGNWELSAQVAISAPEVPFGTIYQPLHNPHLNKLIVGDRESRGVKTFDRRAGFSAALAFISQPGAVGVLVDQHAGNSGLWTPFFGHLASTSPLAATLAARTGAAIVPVAIYIEGFAKWRVAISPPIETGDSIEATTYALNQFLENQIRRSPADWLWMHERWKTPKPHFLTATQKRGVYLPPYGRAVAPAPFRILLRSPNWLGDAVMSVSAARAFKQGRPDAHLTILCPDKLAAIWRLVPEVDEIISTAGSPLAVARRLRPHGFDVAVLMPNSFRSALEVWLAKIPRRIALLGHRRKWLLNQICSGQLPYLDPTRPLHHADKYYGLAQNCGAVPAEGLPIALPSSPSLPTSLLVCPGAEYGPAKRYPAPLFAAAMERIARKTGATWTIVGSPSDAAAASEIIETYRSDPSTITNLVGKTTLEELIALLSNCSLLLTNDTGTMHLADLLGVPLVAIFGSTEPRLTGPRNPQSRVLRYQVACSPCFLRECPRDFRCMHSLRPETVAAEVLDLLDYHG